MRHLIQKRLHWNQMLKRKHLLTKLHCIARMRTRPDSGVVGNTWYDHLTVYTKARLSWSAQSSLSKHC